MAEVMIPGPAQCGAALQIWRRRRQRPAHQGAGGEEEQGVEDGVQEDGRQVGAPHGFRVVPPKCGLLCGIQELQAPGVDHCRLVAIGRLRRGPPHRRRRPRRQRGAAGRPALAAPAGACGLAVQGRRVSACRRAGIVGAVPAAMQAALAVRHCGGSLGVHTRASACRHGRQHGDSRARWPAAQTRAGHCTNFMQDAHQLRCRANASTTVVRELDDARFAAATAGRAPSGLCARRAVDACWRSGCSASCWGKLGRSWRGQY